MISKYMFIDKNSKLLTEIISNRVINNIMINQIGSYNMDFICKSNLKLNKPKLKRESSCQLYMQSVLVNTKEDLDKIWIYDRIVRAKKKQEYINNSYRIHNIYKRYNNGDGYLLYDLIQSRQSQKEILLFRLINSNKKYKKILQNNLLKNLNVLPTHCVNYIISYLTYKIDYTNYI